MKIVFYPRKYFVQISIIIFLVTIFGVFGTNVKKSSALLGFGGKIINVIPCTGSDGTAIVVMPPITPTNPTQIPRVYILENLTSISYKHYQLFRPGPWIVGSYVPGGVCSLNDGEGGSTDITHGLSLMSGGAQIGTIVMNGTSM